MVDSTVKSALKSTLEEAKLGDPQALRQLMSGPLRKKGIDVVVERKGALLFITLAGKTCPPKQGSLSYIQQGIQKLGVSGIDSVRLSGYQSGSLTPQWVERLNLQAENRNGLNVQQSPATYQPQDPAQRDSAGKLKKALLLLVSLVALLGSIGLAMSLVRRPSSPQSTTEPAAEFFVQPTTERPATE